MKIAEIREIATNELAERIEAEVAKYNQMVLNHSISPLENPAQIKSLYTLRKNTRFTVSSSARRRNITLTMRRTNAILVIPYASWRLVP